MNLLSAILGVLALLVPEASFANYIQPPANAAGGGSTGLVNYLRGWQVSLTSVYAGFLALMLVMYAARMIFFAHSETEKAESKSAYVYAILGAIVISVASELAKSVQPEGGATIINSGLLSPILDNVLTLVSGLLYGALMANIAAQGMRIVSSLGDQGLVDKARKRLIGGFIGAVIVLLATVIKDSIVGKNTSPFAQEIVGLAQFLLTFVGAGSVIAIIVGGIFLVISYDDSFKEKAKTAIKTGVVALVVVIMSYAFLNTVVTALPG